MNIVLRIVASFVLLWLVMRILGKKEMGRLTFYNMASAAAFGTLAASLATDTKTNPLYYIGATISYFALTYIMGYASLKSITARRILEDTPTLVIANGKIMENSLRDMRLSTDNLMEKLREKKVFNIRDVEFAVMEPDGKISVLLKSQNQPVTPKDLHLNTQYQGLPTNVIKDGKIVEENLKDLNLTRSWINEQLKLYNITDIEDVVLAQLDTSGKLYVDTKKDY